MELTGKAKKDFKKWLWADIDLNNDTNIVLATIKYGFKDFPFSMQYGVYVDWFDSVGINITDGYGRFTVKKVYYYWVIQLNGEKGQYEKKDGDTTNETRPEARTEAIQKANEIYNTKVEV